MIALPTTGNTKIPPCGAMSVQLNAMDNAPAKAEPTMQDGSTRSGSDAANGIAPSVIKASPMIKLVGPDFLSCSVNLFLNKSVAVPLCDTDKCTMEFYSISSFDDLESGAYGIYEPKKECLKITADENTVCIVPGLAFDKSGFRIGFGKGYYDRFLSEFKGESVGLCYDECFSDILIKDKFDMCVSAVITETCIYKTRQ